jgi:hypothetical protein
MTTFALATLAFALAAIVLGAHFALVALAWIVLWPAVVVGHLLWRGNKALAHWLINLPGDAVHYVEHHFLRG